MNSRRIEYLEGYGITVKVFGLQLADIPRGSGTSFP